MAYYNPNNQQGNYNPYPGQGFGAFPSPAPVNQGLNWVQGEAGAKSWLISRGETVLLMDSEKPVFYIKSSDQSGMPLPLRIFDYSERKQDCVQASNSAIVSADGEFVTRKEYEAICGKYDELRGMIEELQKPKTTRKKEVVSDEQ